MVFDRMKIKGIYLVLLDMPIMHTNMDVVTAGIAYIRMHGKVVKACVAEG